jgi:hypothetical protein
MGPDDVLTVNVWNKGKNDVIVDDIEIVYGEAPERRGQPSAIDAKAIYDKKFQQQNNKPPFPVLWMDKQEVGDVGGLGDFNPGDTYIVGNFADNGNGLDELLCIGKQKQALYGFNPTSKQFIRLWENPDHNHNDRRWFPSNSYFTLSAASHAKLIVQNSQGFVRSLVFNGSDWVNDAEAPKASPSNKSDGPIESFSGSFTNNEHQLLEYDHTWRFDLKLKEGNNILGTVDFRGYPEDHNPKYYEFVKLVPGHFTQAKRTSVLVIMANCADNDFKGDNCKTIENVPYLPNSTQLYQFAE